MCHNQKLPSFGLSANGNMGSCHYLSQILWEQQRSETRIHMVQHSLCDIGVRYWGPAKSYKIDHFAVGQISTIIYRVVIVSVWQYVEMRHNKRQSDTRFLLLNYLSLKCEHSFDRFQPNFSSVLTTSGVWRPPPGTIDGVCICEPKRFCYHDNFSWEITLILRSPTNAPSYWSERWISHTRPFLCYWIRSSEDPVQDELLIMSHWEAATNF